MLEIVLKVVLPVVFALTAYTLILILVRKLILKRIRIKEETKTKVYRNLRLLLRIFVLTALLVLVLTFLGPNIANFFKGLWKIMTSPLLTAGTSRITIVTILLTIPIFFLASWFSRITKRFFDSTLLARLSLADETKFTISILMRNGVMILAILMGLSIIGIDLSTLAILFGVLGIGLGFGLQGTVANFIAGFVLIFERPIKEGDRIQVAGMEGEVIHIRFRATIINTLANETIIVPNKILIDDNLHNYSYGDNRIIIINRIQVAYSADLDRASEVLIGVADANPFAIAKPEPEVRVLAFQDSGILLELRTWIEKATERHEAMSWNNLEIWRQFKRQQVPVPFPQMDLHIKELPPAAESSV